LLLLVVALLVTLPWTLLRLWVLGLLLRRGLPLIIRLLLLILPALIIVSALLCVRRPASLLLVLTVRLVLRQMELPILTALVRLPFTLVILLLLLDIIEGGAWTTLEVGLRGILGPWAASMRVLTALGASESSHLFHKPVNFNTIKLEKRRVFNFTY
jgi:hypothetical protein